MTKVEFLRDGVMYGQDTTSPYSASVDTTTVSNGSHTFGARAYDAAGNTGTAANVTVTVNNLQAASSCPVSTPHVPGGPDGNGGCWPGVDNTGPNAAASSMPTYTGSCTISTANTVIDSKVVNCRTIVVAASGFVLKNSYLNGGIVQSGGNPSFTMQDSFIDSGVMYPAASSGAPAGKYACGDTGNATSDCGVTGSNFTILRTEIINSNRAAYCEAPGPCLIQDSYFHGTNLWPDASNLAHASSVREEQRLTFRHNRSACSYTGPFVNGEIGCSADLTGYPDFAPIKNNTVDRNLFVATAGSRVLRLRRRHGRKAVLGRLDERDEPGVHEQRVPARRERQVRRLRAGHRFQDRSHRATSGATTRGTTARSSTRASTEANGHAGRRDGACPASPLGRRACDRRIPSPLPPG